MDSWFTALIGFVAGGGGAMALQFLADRHKRARDDRADAIGEWREIVNNQQAQLNLQAERINKLQEQHARCEREAAELRGEVRLLQASVRRLQGLSGDTAPSVMTAALLVADMTGKVLVASPSVMPLFHYQPQELLHRSVEVLIPERLRQAHRDSLSRLAAGGPPPWTERTILTHGLTKEGEEFPIAITLAAWQTEKKEWLVSADIRRRPQPPAV